MVDAAQRSRHALATISGVGAENVLSHLAHSVDDDEAWLRSLVAFATVHGDDTARQRRDSVTGLILLG